MNQLGLLHFILLYASPIMLRRSPFIQKTAVLFMDLFHFTVNSRHLGLTSSEGLSGLSYELFYSARRSSKFYLSILLSVEVLQVNVPAKRSIESY